MADLLPVVAVVITFIFFGNMVGSQNPGVTGSPFASTKWSTPSNIKRIFWLGSIP